jgi:hypothetical protein
MDFSKTLNCENILQLNLKKFGNIVLGNDFFKNPGDQHYRLLAYFSTLFDKINIIEIGTHLGESAVALSYNDNNTIYTFDIIDKTSEDKKNRSNVKYIIDDIMTNDESRNKWKDLILSSAFIFLDVDPHNGSMEYDFYLFLKENNYQGFVICDDIWYFKEMRDNLWYHIDSEYKYDITQFGHWSGSGLVTFNKDITLNITKSDHSNWTLVTAYFNLTKCYDASPEINAKDFNYYLSHSLSTLTLPHNLVIFCDEDSIGYIKKLMHVK